MQGAEEIGQMEHLLNVYASRVARGHCADFLGYCEVSEEQATARLTAGLWLVSGYSTLQPGTPEGWATLCIRARAAC